MSARVVLCFPHAGAGRFYYERWRSPFERHGLTMQIAPYPNRGNRAGEPMPARMEDLAEDMFARLEDALASEFVMWGHSMGGLVAYEVAKLARRRLGRSPALFVASGAPAPGGHQYRVDGFLGSVDEVTETIRGRGWIDEEALRNAEFVEHIVPIVQGDMKMLSAYSDPRPMKMDCPVLLMQGDDDPIDIAGWSAIAGSKIDLLTYRGGHFFIADHVSAVTTDIASHIARRIPRSLP